MKREFVINRHGKDYVLYAGLLDEAHQQGLSAIRTQLVQPPAAENGQVAICLAEVTTERGTFTGLGDASPDNVSRAMVNALIRLAETRAKARALRDAINVSMVAVEELAEMAPESLAVDGADAPPPLPRLVPSNGAHGTTVAAGANGINSTHASTHAVTGGVPASVPMGHTLPPGVVPLPTRPAPAAPSDSSSPGRHDADGAFEAPRSRRIRESVAASAGKAPADNAPATPTQLETIAKLARSVGRIMPAQQDLTRAAASELITRLSEERYGARRGN